MSQQCQCIARSTTQRCKNKASNGSKYCHISSHQKCSDPWVELFPQSKPLSSPKSRSPSPPKAPSSKVRTPSPKARTPSPPKSPPKKVSTSSPTSRLAGRDGARKGFIDVRPQHLLKDYMFEWYKTPTIWSLRYSRVLVLGAPPSNVIPKEELTKVVYKHTLLPITIYTPISDSDDDDICLYIRDWVDIDIKIEDGTLGEILDKLTPHLEAYHWFDDWFDPVLGYFNELLWNSDKQRYEAVFERG